MLVASGITKSFGHVQALRGASIELGQGEVVALVGDNGAGKSTLVSVLSGALVPDSGSVTVDGVPLSFGSIDGATECGIATVYQDLSLAFDLTPADNIFLSKEIHRRGLLGFLGFLDDKSMKKRAKEVLGSLGVALKDDDAAVEQLSGGQRQAVAIARAVLWASKLVIMDEPTAALGARQTAIVMETIEAAKKRGLTVLIVSHDLPRVIEMSDRIVVMRHGQIVDILSGGDVRVSDIVTAMLGGTEDQPASGIPPKSPTERRS
jgi:ABC-type sugar transport system ATPase subunit